MSAVLLDPHGDDAALFAAFTCLRESPHVVVVLRSAVQETRGGPDFTRREAELAAAMDVLGCTWEQWAIPDDAPRWEQAAERIKGLASFYDHCYAPAEAWEANGHAWHNKPPSGVEPGVRHHDRVGFLACKMFGAERVTGYQTYTMHGGKTRVGDPVESRPEWVLAKLRALVCYESQVLLPATAPHFAEDLAEFTAPAGVGC